MLRPPKTSLENLFRSSELAILAQRFARNQGWRTSRGLSRGIPPQPRLVSAELLGMFMPVTCTRGRSRLAHGREDARPAGQQCPAPTRPAPQQALHCVSGCLRGSCFPPPFLRFHPCGPARNPAGLRSAWAEAGVRPVSKCWCGSAPAEPLFSSFIHVLVWDTSATSSDLV